MTDPLIICYDATNIQNDNLKGYWRNDGLSVWTDLSGEDNEK